MNKAGDLFTECRRLYGLEPEEVLGMLGFQDAKELSSSIGLLEEFDNLLESIRERLTLRTNRVLRPEIGKGALEVELDRAERRAFEAAASMRFPDFGHWAGVWASLNTAIGRPYRTSPFSRFASLARDLLRED